MELWTNILFFVSMLPQYAQQFTKWAARLLAVASDTVQNSIKSLFIYREKEFLQCNLLQVTMGSISSTFPNINCIFTLSWVISAGAMYRITLIFWCHMYSVQNPLFWNFWDEELSLCAFPFELIYSSLLLYSLVFSNCLSLYLVTITQLGQVCWKITQVKEKKEESEKGRWRPDVTVRLCV